MNEQQGVPIIGEPTIALAQYEKDLLGLPAEQGDIPLSQAGWVVERAQQTRASFLGECAANQTHNPKDYFQMYELSFEQRRNAALATALIGRVSEYALRTHAYHMDLQQVPEES